MASTPAYAVLLAGLGAVDLSMTPNSISRVRAALSAIDTREAQAVALRCLDCRSADEAEEIVREEFEKRWPDLFSPRSLPARPDRN